MTELNVWALLREIVEKNDTTLMQTIAALPGNDWYEKSKLHLWSQGRDELISLSHQLRAAALTKPLLAHQYQFSLSDRPGQFKLSYYTPYKNELRDLTLSQLNARQCLACHDLREILILLATQKLGRYESFYTIVDRMRHIDPRLSVKEAHNIICKLFPDGYHSVARKDIADLLRKTMPLRLSIQC